MTELIRIPIFRERPWVPHGAGAATGCWRRVLTVTAGFAMFLALIAAAAAESAVSKEYQIKAAFLYNFAKFVEWPAQSFTDAGSPIVIGVSCPIALDAELEQVVKGRKINGRDLVVKNFGATDEATFTHLLFVCAAVDSGFDGMRKAIGGNPVLTVGESDDFDRLGGMITFVREGDKIRFKINMTPAEQAGLKVSSQLQKLALSVRRAP